MIHLFNSIGQAACGSSNDLDGDAPASHNLAEVTCEECRRRFGYVIQRKTATGAIEYYSGGGFWSASASAAEKYDGHRATAICINMANRGIDATFVLAPA